MTSVNWCTDVIDKKVIPGMRSCAMPDIQNCDQIHQGQSHKSCGLTWEFTRESNREFMGYRHG